MEFYRGHLWEYGTEKDVCKRCGLIRTNRKLKCGMRPRCFKPEKGAPFSKASPLIKNEQG